MNLVIKKDPFAPNLYCVYDEDTEVVKYSNIYENYCKDYIEEHQPKLIIDKRRKKLREFDLLNWDYVCSKNIQYKGNIKTKGILFYFKALNKKEIEYILHFKNTEILNIQKEYAPEIHYKGIAIYEKCIR